MKRFLRMGVLLLGGLFAFLGGEAQMKHTLTIRVKARAEITGQPVAASKICELSPLTLGVKVTGEGAVAYRWLKKTGATYTELPGATSDTLRIVSASPVDAGDYVCEVTGECNADTSAVANVVVNPAPTLSFPPDLDICGSAPQDVDLTFTGTAPFTYRITGDTEDRTVAATPATITLGPSVTTIYRLVSLMDANGCRALRVEGGELAGPVGDIAPGVPFTVRSLSGAEVKTRSRILYSWTVNGTAVEGSGDTLLYTAATGGDYYFVRTAQIGELESSVAGVTVTVKSCPVDGDNNKYETVTIGGKEWLASNLKAACKTGSCWCYNNDVSNCNTYGRLYTWSAAMNGSTSAGAQGLCPVGWHLPTDAEWQTLEMALGMTSSDVNAIDWRNGGSVGTQLKSGGISKMNMLLGGWYKSGSFLYMGSYSHCWSSTENDSLLAWGRTLGSSEAGVGRVARDKTVYGYYVRCVKN